MTTLREIIYTHCRGMDLRSGRMTAGDADYSFYSADDGLRADAQINLQFVDAAARHSFVFADRRAHEHQFAYFAAPAVGAGRMMLLRGSNFDHSAWQKSDRRPGKFINQCYIGDFSALHPAQVMAADIWDAHDRGLDFYNTIPSRGAKPRTVQPDDGHFAHIGEFVRHANRRDVLKSAIAFLLAQYARRPHERRFLVIRDGSAENIQNWIAAIHYALPQKMAAAVSFATKGDPAGNSYAVDRYGAADAHRIDRAPRKSLRRKFMLLGCTDADDSAASAEYATIGDGRPLAADTASPLYATITGFNKPHSDFVDFAQAHLPAGIEPDLQALALLHKTDGCLAALQGLRGMGHGEMVSALAAAQGALGDLGRYWRRVGKRGAFGGFGE